MFLFFAYKGIGAKDCLSKQCTKIGVDCPPINVEKRDGNPLLDFIDADYDPNYNVNGETHIEISEKPKTVVNLRLDEVEGYIRENDYGNMEQSRSIVKQLSASNSLRRSFNLFKCDDTRYDFDCLPNERKTYENFWNKRLTLSYLLVSGVKHPENNTVTLKLKKVMGTIKKRKAEKLTRSRTVDTQVCYYRERCTNYQKVTSPYHSSSSCVPRGQPYERNHKEVKAQQTFNEIKYQFPTQVKWSAAEINDLFQNLYSEMAERIFLY